LLNWNDKFLGILFESLNIKIFNNERVLADIEAVEREEFLDFYVDFNEENLFVISLVEGRIIEVKQFGLSYQSISAKSKRLLITKELELKEEKAENGINLNIIFRWN
jgi:hypothetical protein